MTNRSDDALAQIKHARRILGDWTDIPEFRGAAASSAYRQLPHKTQMRKALQNNGDLQGLLGIAILAHGLPLDNDNRKNVQNIVAMANLRKFETNDVVAPPHEVIAYSHGAEELVEPLQLAFSKQDVVELHLHGRHSGGAQLAFLGGELGLWILKPEDAVQVPCAGYSDSDLSGPERETAFYYAVRAAWPGQEYYPRVELLDVDGRQYAAIKMLGIDYHPANHVDNITKYLRDYLDNGALFRWALWDMVLGNPDSHGGNLMVAPTGQVALIDHGAALCGRNFAPALDPNSFIPFYLRAFNPQLDWAKAPPGERYAAMPHPSATQCQEFDTYLMSQCEARAAFEFLDLVDGNVAQAARERYEKLQGQPNKLEYLLRWWAGCVF